MTNLYMAFDDSIVTSEVNIVKFIHFHSEANCNCNNGDVNFTKIIVWIVNHVKVTVWWYFHDRFSGRYDVEIKFIGRLTCHILNSRNKFNVLNHWYPLSNLWKDDSYSQKQNSNSTIRIRGTKYLCLTINT